MLVNAVAMTEQRRGWRTGTASDVPLTAPIRLVSQTLIGGPLVHEYRTNMLMHPTRGWVLLPMPVDVRSTDGYWVVAEPRSGIHGVGDDASEAIRDFWRALDDFDESLTVPLAPNLREQRAVVDLFLTA